LRFHPGCPWRGDTGRVEYVPCLLAAFRSIDDRAITGIHRIRVDQPKRWPKTDRRMLGVVRRAAVMTAPFVPRRLAAGEGVETCLAVRQLGLARDVWALGSVGAITFFPIIEVVRELLLIEEAGAASARAIGMCGERWRRAGRRVIVEQPPVGCPDHNDFVLQQRGRTR
jgi:putative DNA primase/helicase